jgi:hypothetical protein
MVLSKSELIAALQNEVRIVLHLASKIDRSKLDYRPTPKQRSILELLRYLSMMGPTIVRYILAEPPEMEIWTKADEASKARDFDQAVAAIEAQRDLYATLLGDLPESALRAEVTDFEGNKTSRGAFIVNLVLCGSAAYRMQLFLYLKASGREDLDSSNLWSGVDGAAG